MVVVGVACCCCISLRLVLMLVLTFAPCACSGSTGGNLRWWHFSLDRWRKDFTCICGGLTHCNLPQWCFSFHPLAQIPDLHSGNLHCVVVVFWWSLQKVPYLPSSAHDKLVLAPYWYNIENHCLSLPCMVKHGKTTIMIFIVVLPCMVNLNSGFHVIPVWGKQ